MDPLLAHRCGVCNVPAVLMCSRCQTKAYCTAGCQKRDWAAHKKQCVCASTLPAAAAVAVAAEDEVGNAEEDAAGGAAGGAAGAAKSAVEDDAAGLVENDVQLVMQQSGCERARAITALRTHGGDLVASIMSLL